MQRQNYLASVERHFNPELVAISKQAIKQLELPAASAVLVGCRFPFERTAFALGAEGAACGHAEYAVHYLLAQTALQYRFWAKDETGFRRYVFEGAIGSTGMMRAFDRAWGDSPVPGDELAQVASGIRHPCEVFGDIPDPQSRRVILAEVLGPKGQAVAKAVTGMVLAERKVTIDQAAFVARALPEAYGDVFLKKAMLFVGLVAGWARETLEVGDELAAFADYQVPNVLRHFGVLQYGCEMRAAVDNQQLLPASGERENAIRSATVLACEEIAEHFGVTSAEVDWWAFQQRRAPATPFHLTLTTNY